MANTFDHVHQHGRSVAAHWFREVVEILLESRDLLEGMPQASA